MFTCEPANVNADTQFSVAYARTARILTRYTREYWGPRCGDYEPDCGCCKAWRVVDDFTALND